MEARKEYRRRVLAVHMWLFAGSTPIGNAVTGLVSGHSDIRVALGVNGIVCITGVVLAGVYVWPPACAPPGGRRSRDGLRCLASTNLVARECAAGASTEAAGHSRAAVWYRRQSTRGRTT